MREALSIEQLKDVCAQLAKRYDWQHAMLTARSDQRGRELLVDRAVREGDEILDCGAGATGIPAAKKASPRGKVTMFDLSDPMLAVAREKVTQEGLQGSAGFSFIDKCDNDRSSTKPAPPVTRRRHGGRWLIYPGGGCGMSTEPGELHY